MAETAAWLMNITPLPVKPPPIAIATHIVTNVASPSPSASAPATAPTATPMPMPIVTPPISCTAR